MAKRSRTTAKLEASLKSARARARKLADTDPVQELGFGALGGAIVALMNNNNLKLPIPGVPASLQVAATALVIQKGLRPRGMTGKALKAAIAGGAAVFGYGLANKFGPGGNVANALMGDHDGYIGDDSYIGSAEDNVSEG